VICENDKALPVEKQEAMIEDARRIAREEGGKVVPFDVVERLAAGHSPFISCTGKLAEILDRAAGGA